MSGTTEGPEVGLGLGVVFCCFVLFLFCVCVVFCCFGLFSVFVWGFLGWTSPGFFWIFLRDQFALIESSGDQNLTMFILHFHFFFHLRPPQIQKSPLTDPHKNPDPWDHAQMIEHTILCRIALTRAPETQTRP